MFFQIFVAKGDTGQFFLKKLAYDQYNFYEQTCKFLGGHGFSNLIQKYSSE